MLAQEQARLLGHPYIGPEHLFLGLTGLEEGPAAKALASAEIDLERARAEVARIAGSTTGPIGISPPFTPRAKRALEGALREAIARGSRTIGTEHLLLAVLSLPDGVVDSTLHALGTNGDDLRRRLEDVMADRTPDDVAFAAQLRRDRIHILEGLVRGIDGFAAVTEALQGCTDRPRAIEVLTAPPFGFSETQARHLLDLPVASVIEQHRHRLAEELHQLERELAQEGR